MGIEYELVDLKNRRRFELGKWYEGARFLPSLVLQRPVPDEETFVSIAKLEMAEAEVEQLDAAGARFYEQLFHRIWAFCRDAGGDVALLEDAGGASDYLLDVDWPRADSMYARPRCFRHDDCRPSAHGATAKAREFAEACYRETNGAKEPRTGYDMPEAREPWGELGERELESMREETRRRAADWDRETYVRHHR